ncbi:Sigma-fimbriae tip adhesin [Acinetobacter sp. neg1]|uniref:Csu type fimbrial protein n=1 Tax=Acinetobacter sp. neg1 TaxID=1561068 RepID=UPI0005426CAF|nr:spore coat U domain-containing protein [Acinetobacter sp. neg1]KHF78800.1 Sigma-fimbriae tip adhesin [Acinetobacter sp. neg1]
MKLYINKYNKSLFFASLFLLPSGYATAGCSVTQAGDKKLLSAPSMSLYESGYRSGKISSGLSCTGVKFGLLNKTFLYYRVDHLANNLINKLTGETLNVNFSSADNNNKPLKEGELVDLSSFSFVNVFSGTDGAVQFDYTIPAGQNVSPGIYTTPAPLQVTWFYSVPLLAGIGIGIFDSSPGFNRGLPGPKESDKGAGVLTKQTLNIEVLPDCRILTNDINFGTEAFVSNFEPVQTSMGIRCSSKTPYKVSLNNGLNAKNGNQRAMKSTTSNDFINYEIYKNNSNERWGLNNESWSSSDATSNPGVHDGITQQNYMFTTKILGNNPDNLPAGLYEDIVRVEVKF